jgi:hypothetical protein
MTSSTQNDPAWGLLRLPSSVAILLFNHIIKVSNAGQLLRLALVRSAGAATATAASHAAVLAAAT